MGLPPSQMTFEQHLKESYLKKKLITEVEYELTLVVPQADTSGKRLKTLAAKMANFGYSVTEEQQAGGDDE